MPARKSPPSSWRPGRPVPEAAPASRAAAVLAAIVCAATLLSLTGCSSDPVEFDDDESPNHMIQAPKSQGKYRFGVTDTLTIDFSEPIDTAALDLRFSDDLAAGYAFRGRSQVLIFGTRKSFGSGHFPINTSFTLDILGLRDDAGNGTPAISEAFQPYPWADRDVLDRSFRGSDSLFSGDTAWVDGSSLADSLIVEGALDFNDNLGDEDRVDIKLVRLTPPDTLDVLVTSRKDVPVNLKVGGPFKEDQLDSVLALAANFSQSTRTTAATGRVDTTFRADFEQHLRILGSSGASGIYALRLSLPTADTEGFYRIRLKLRKFRF